jgi:hypothetical protein
MNFMAAVVLNRGCMKSNNSDLGHENARPLPEENLVSILDMWESGIHSN